MIEIGKRAPAIHLLDERGESFRLSELAGSWVVLYFYPKDDTPGCTTEACEFSEALASFRKLDAAVVGISPDSPASHAKFLAKHGLKVRLLSDPEHEVMEKYDAWGEKVLYGKRSLGVIRSTVLVDPVGKVAWHWKKVRAAGHAEKVREKLEELRASV